MDLIDLVMFLVIFLAVFVTTLVCYARWNYGTLEAMGLPVVKPHWLLGSNYNYLELYHHWEDWDRAKKLGLTYGVYNGRTPEVYTADPEILHKIYFKDSEYFMNKVEHDYGHYIINDILEIINGEKWKLIHSILSPLFTSMKIKRNMQIVNNVCEDHVKVINEEARLNNGRVKMNFHEFLPPFAIEAIAESLCGIKLSDVRSPSNFFVPKMKTMLWGDFTFDWTWNVFQVFPFLMKLGSPYSTEALDFFVEVIKDVLDKREASGEKVSDTVGALLQLRQSCSKEEFKKAGITVNSVYAQAYEFFVASYFGILTAIEYTCYHLAMNPEAQKKAQEEVDKVAEKYNGEISHEALSELTYVTACLQEGFRISPGFFRLDRVCTKDWDSGKGFHIQKGTRVMIPAYAVHHNPDNYPEPGKYMPERFLPENKDKIVPCTFLPFGQGHRQCMGMKQVMEMLKSFMARILRDFDIEKRPDTQWKENPGMHFFLKLDPIYLDLVSRK